MPTAHTHYMDLALDDDSDDLTEEEEEEEQEYADDAKVDPSSHRDDATRDTPAAVVVATNGQHSAPPTAATLAESSRSQRIRRPSRKLVESADSPVALAESPSSVASSSKNAHAQSNASLRRFKSPDAGAFPLSSASSSPSPSSPSSSLSPSPAPAPALPLSPTPKKARKSRGTTDDAAHQSPSSLSAQARTPPHTNANGNGVEGVGRNTSRRSIRRSAGTPLHVAAKQEDVASQAASSADFASVPSPSAHTPVISPSSSTSVLPQATMLPLAASGSATATSSQGRAPSSRRQSSRLSKSVTVYDMDLSSDDDDDGVGGGGSRNAQPSARRPFARVESNASHSSHLSDGSSAITDLPDDYYTDAEDGGRAHHTPADVKPPVAAAADISLQRSAPDVDTDTDIDADGDITMVSSTSRRSLRPRRSHVVSAAQNGVSSPSPAPLAVERTKAHHYSQTNGSSTPPSSSSSPAPSIATTSSSTLAAKKEIGNSSGSGTPRQRGAAGADGKTYLTAGLYAKDNHVDPVAGTLRNGRLGPDGKIIEPPKELFPLPVHFGKDLLVQRVDFELPNAFLAQSGKLKERFDARRKPPPYRQIDRNRYVTRKKIKGELPQCNCDPSSDCGDNCLNRLLGFICDADTCPCGDRCTNVSLAKRPHARCDVAYYGQRGFGLRSLDDIPKDNLVDEYRGEVINLQEAARRVNEIYKDTGNFYFLEYDAAAGEVLDGGLRGNVTRFANHSCNPNCYIEKFIICGTDEQGSAEFQIGLFALRDIAAGEELTYDYGWSQFTPKRVDAPAVKRLPDACYCGAPGCSGNLGAKKLPQTRAGAETTKGAATIARTAEKQAAAAAASSESATAAAALVHHLAPHDSSSTSSSSSSLSPLVGGVPTGAAAAAAASASVLGKRARRHTGRVSSSEAKKFKVSKKGRGAAAATKLSSSNAAEIRRHSEMRAQLLLRQATQMIKENTQLIDPGVRRVVLPPIKGSGRAPSIAPLYSSSSATTKNRSKATAAAAASARTSSRLRKTTKQEPVILTSSPPPAAAPATSDQTAEERRKAERHAKKLLKRAARREAKAASYPKQPPLPVIKQLSAEEAFALMQRNLADRGLTSGLSSLAPTTSTEPGSPSAAAIHDDGTTAATAAAAADQSWFTMNEDDDDEDDDDSSDDSSDSDSVDGEEEDIKRAMATKATTGQGGGRGSQQTSDTSMSTSVDDASYVSADSEERVEASTAGLASANASTNDVAQLAPRKARGPIFLADYPADTKFRYADGKPCPRKDVEAMSKVKNVYSEDEHRAKRRSEYQRRQQEANQVLNQQPVTSSRRSRQQPGDDPGSSNKMDADGDTSMASERSYSLSTNLIPPAGAKKLAKRSAPESESDDEEDGDGTAAKYEERTPPRKLASSSAARAKVRSVFAPRALVSAAGHASSPISPPPPKARAAAAAAAPTVAATPTASSPVARKKKGRPSQKEAATSAGLAASPVAGPSSARAASSAGSPVASSSKAALASSPTASSSGKSKPAKPPILTMNGTPRAVNHRPSVVSRKGDGTDAPPDGRQQYQSTRDLPHNIMTPDGYFIPGLPTELLDMGVFEKMKEARKARNAFLVRIRRNLVAGMDAVDATDEAAYRPPQSGTPLAWARTAMAEKLKITLPTINMYLTVSRDQRTSTDPKLAEALANSLLPERAAQVQAQTQAQAEADEVDDAVQAVAPAAEEPPASPSTGSGKGKGKARQID